MLSLPHSDLPPFKGAKTLKKIEKRRWLNPKGTAFINYEIEPHHNGSGCWATMKIGDCSRSVNLEFGFDSKKEFDERVKKVDDMIKDLQDLRSGLIKIGEKSYVERTNPFV
jgi:hypothetical protein